MGKEQRLHFPKTFAIPPFYHGDIFKIAIKNNETKLQTIIDLVSSTKPPLYGH